MFQKIETIKKNQMTNVPHQVTKCHKGHDKLSLDLMTTCQVKDYSIIDSSIGDNIIIHTQQNYCGTVFLKKKN